jgi:hypothetical protein
MDRRRRNKITLHNRARNGFFLISWKQSRSLQEPQGSLDDPGSESPEREYFVVLKITANEDGEMAWLQKERCTSQWQLLCQH